MGVAASLPRRRPRSRAHLAAFARSGVAPLLLGVVAVSALVRGLAGALKATPAYFPDEYMYSELGRSLADTGRPLVRGADAHFPALLQPLLTAPAWLLDDVGSAYAVVKWIGAVAISLAAVPVFVLGRRLGLGPGLALGAAALSLATPSLFYASWVMGEPFAYPLALAAVAAGTLALSGGGRRAQLAFLGFAALAAFARAQFVVLPFCFLAAAVLMGLRERGVRAALREQGLVLGVLVVPLALALALMPQRFLGIYASPDLALDVDLPARVGSNALGVAYAAGWILVPGALVGLALALARPRSSAELAFGALAVPLGVALLLEASLLGDVGRIQERYTFYLVPVVGLAFCLFASRGWPARRAHALLAGGLLAASAAVPLAVHTADAAKTQSAFLFGVDRLERLLGGTGTGPIAIAGVLAALTAAGALLSLRPRSATPVALALAICFCAAASVLTVDFERRNSNGVRGAFLPAERSWVDRAEVGEVALVRGLGLRTDTMQQMFWNRSVQQLLLLPGAERFDAFAAEELQIASDGALLAGGRPLRKALLVDEWASRIRFHGAVTVASSPGFSLWKPAGTPRLALYSPGYYKDGWLAMRVGLNLWAPPGRTLTGRLSFSVSAPDYLPQPVTLRVQAGDRRLHTFRLRPGDSQAVHVPICAETTWFGALLADRGIILGDRVVSARATPPRFRPDPAACR